MQDHSQPTDAGVARRRHRLAALALLTIGLGGGVAAVALAAAADPRGTGAERAAAEPIPRTSPRRAPPLVRIAAVGDVTLGSPAGLPSDDGSSLFGDVRRSLTGDLVLGNLETPLTAGGASKCSEASRTCFAFRAPPLYARTLRGAGFTMLNVANNHALDFGAQGQTETIAALDAERLLHTGRPGEIAYARAGRLRIAVIGFAPYPWAQQLLDLDAARALVREADARADVVVVTMHAGGEGLGRDHVSPGDETYLGEPRGDPVAFAHAVVDAGGDLVVGHGPHVLRGLEWYRGRLIAYSLGNFSGYRTLAVEGALAFGAILRVRLHADGTWADGSLVPIRLVGTGTPELDRDRTAIAKVRALSKEDFGRAGGSVSASGRIVARGAR